MQWCKQAVLAKRITDGRSKAKERKGDPKEPAVKRFTF